MHVPVSLCDRIDAEETILSAFLDYFRPAAAEAIAIDATIDHDVRDVDAQWAILARHALSDHAQARFGRGKVGETRLAAHAARCSGEQDRPPPQRYEPARCFPSHQEAAEAADAPEVLEHLGREFAKIELAIVARVVCDRIGRIESCTGGHGLIEQAHDV